LALVLGLLEVVMVGHGGATVNFAPLPTVDELVRPRCCGSAIGRLVSRLWACVGQRASGDRWTALPSNSPLQGIVHFLIQQVPRCCSRAGLAW
jgi:hypothetical protein